MIDTATVVFLGLGIVFLGLVAVIVLITIIGAIMRKASGKAKAAPAPAAAPQAAAPQAVEIPNKQEFVAAVSAAIAEETGSDVTRIRIHKIERV